MSYDNPNTVVAVFLQTLSTTAVCLGPRLFKKKFFFSFNVCMCVSVTRPKYSVATMAALWNSAGLSQPTADSWLPDVSQPRGSLSSSPTAEPFWSVLWWGLTTLCKLHPRSEGGLILPEGRCGEGEGKEQSLLGTEMGWVRFVLQVQPLLLIKRLIFNLGIQSLP